MDRIAYSIPHSAEKADTSVATIRREIAKGNIIVRYLTERQPVIEHDELVKWVHSRPTEPPGR